MVEEFRVNNLNIIPLIVWIGIFSGGSIGATQDPIFF